jgi:hypothetical protein
MIESRYFSERWHAAIPIQDLFWQDLIVRGTLINAAITFLGLMLIAQGYPSLWALGLHLLVLPYNLFLVLAVVRRPDAQMSFKLGAAGWLILTSVA